jgi:hypothetical protein
LASDTDLGFTGFVFGKVSHVLPAWKIAWVMLLCYQLFCMGSRVFGDALLEMAHIVMAQTGLQLLTGCCGALLQSVQFCTASWSAYLGDCSVII